MKTRLSLRFLMSYYNFRENTLIIMLSADSRNCLLAFTPKWLNRFGRNLASDNNDYRAVLQIIFNGSFFKFCTYIIYKSTTIRNYRNLINIK